MEMAADSEMEKGSVFAEEDLVVELQTLLHGLMQEKGISRAELARLMGVSRARVTQIFSDDCKNFTVRLLARALYALGEKAVISCEREEKGGRSREAFLDQEDLRAMWGIKETLSSLGTLVPSNDDSPIGLAGIKLSQLEWEAA